MGGTESIPSRPQSRSYQCSPRSARSQFNFTGVKDLHKNSYFSCLCSDSNNENEKKEIENFEQVSQSKSEFRPETRLADINQQNILDSFRAEINKSESSFDAENDLEIASKAIHAKGKSCFNAVTQPEFYREEDVERFSSVFGQSPIFKDDECESLTSSIVFELNDKVS